VVPTVWLIPTPLPFLSAPGHLLVSQVCQSHQLSFLCSYFLPFLIHYAAVVFVVLFCLIVLKCKLRASCSLGRHSTSWVTTPVLFALLVLEIGSCFLPRLTWTTVHLFYASFCHLDATPSFFPLRWYLTNLFAGTGLKPTILPISASRVTWDSRHTPLCPVTGWSGVSQTLCPGWRWTAILLISVSQVARRESPALSL
jgi:hypothetical protein